MLGGLEHHAVAGSQRRGELPGGHVEREVPRHHGGDHAEGFAGDGGQRVGRGGCHLVVQLVQRLTVPGEHLRRARHIDVVGVHDRLAHVQRVEQGQFFAMGHDQLGQAQQHFLALTRGHARPWALFESPAGAGDGQVDLGLAAGGDLGQHLVGGGVDGGEGGAVLCADGLAVDQCMGREVEVRGTLLPEFEGVHLYSW
ncbi:hypothetical protein D3C72_1441110 [compost metagenome]